MADVWERCQICGREWAAGTLKECARYRDAEHRRRRTNVRSRDVATVDKTPPAAALPLPSDGAPVKTELAPRTVPIHPSRLEIVVVGHLRHGYLQDALRMWAATTPGYRGIVVIANHPTTLNGIALPERTTAVQSGKVPNHGGQLSDSWNLGLLWTFCQHADTEWVVLSQDDVKIAPGWLELVNRYDADFYNAPAGDMVMLLNRHAFQRVGWFDEHLRTIGGQDLDWIARAVITLGERRVVSEDYHGWRYNPIGLERYWESAKGGATPGASYLAGGDVDVKLKVHLGAKWGINTEQLRNALIGHAVPSPAQPEYDWYPWAPR